MGKETAEKRKSRIPATRTIPSSAYYHPRSLLYTARWVLIAIKTTTRERVATRKSLSYPLVRETITRRLRR